ncbi:hypothetical protein GEO21_11910 [Sphingobacterium faecium]|uniref:hypothetical protein n=1 Tax=Sphingobacterium faecium TaxID=34087 RepID=UPI00129116F9|nr:hypothetical protein [Sphingobacterium faecium]MQP28211.1 hypothetical protein [Sphingobacterium faecium]
MITIEKSNTKNRQGLIICVILENSNTIVPKQNNLSEQDYGSENQLQDSRRYDPLQEVGNAEHEAIELENQEDGLIDRVDPDSDKLNPEEDELEIDNPKEDLLEGDPEEEVFDDDDRDIEEDGLEEEDNEGNFL